METGSYDPGHPLGANSRCELVCKDAWDCTCSVIQGKHVWLVLCSCVLSFCPATLKCSAVKANSVFLISSSFLPPPTPLPPWHRMYVLGGGLCYPPPHRYNHYHNSSHNDACLLKCFARINSFNSHKCLKQEALWLFQVRNEKTGREKSNSFVKFTPSRLWSRNLNPDSFGPPSVCSLCYPVAPRPLKGWICAQGPTLTTASYFFVFVSTLVCVSLIPTEDSCFIFSSK